MSVRQYANAPATALANSCTSLATSIEVDSVTGLPITYPFTLIIDRGTASEEAVEVTAAAGTTLTVTRGIDSTTAFAHSSGAEVVHGITARDLAEPNAHINADSGVHGVTGDVVGTTDAQMLTNKTATTPDPSSDDETIATTEFVKAVLLAAHPVGTIRMQTVSTNPSSFIGGTWDAWGTGRVPVGIDSGQTEFDTVEETGGAKTVTLTADQSGLRSHTHSDSGAVSSAFVSAAGSAYGVTIPDATTTGSVAASDALEAHDNLQPYIVCYMFKRTA